MKSARSFALAWILSFASACTPAPTQPDIVSPPPSAELERAAAVDCGPEIGGAAPLLHEGGVILLGEMHGSIEIPDFVGALACHAAREGLEIRLGLEIPRGEAPALATYLASAGGPDDRDALLAGEHWQRSGQDGRSSVAMLALIDRVRVLRAAGLALELFAFDVDVHGAWNDRDAAMAAAILAEQRAHPRALVLTLSGNLHVRTQAGLPWDPEAVPMGVHVRAGKPDTLALDVRYGGGSVWVCQPVEGGGQACGPMTLEGREPGEVPRIEIAGERDEAGIDGVFWLRELSPASPAVAGDEAD
ncbi:hypothetical protein ACNOYE_08645 [Nannocystaceae bacterium ST9]